MNVCVLCGIDKTRVNSKGCPNWCYLNGDKTKRICMKCYLNNRYKNTKSTYSKKAKQNYQDKKEEYKERNSRMLLFKDKRIHLDHNPRTGTCKKCGKVGHTNIHHEKYHDDDPLKDTIELCVGCHRKEHHNFI